MFRLRLAVPLLLGALVGAIAYFWPDPGPQLRGGERVAESSGGGKAAAAPARRDLARDEAGGGHTLSRHVGHSDEELRRRLADESGISAASTFSDRETAERVVAATLERESKRIESWLERSGGNLALTYRGAPGESIGRTLERGERVPQSAHEARVVLGRRGTSFTVVTAYPLQPR